MPVQSRTDDRVRRLDLVDVVDEVAVGHGQAGGLAGRGGQLLERRAGDGRDRADQAKPRGERHEPRPEPVRSCRPGTCSTAPSPTSVASRRAAVDLGRPARSATSVTPERAVGERAEHVECSSDGLDAGHGPLRRLNSRLCEFHHTARFHDVEPLKLTVAAHDRPTGADRR